CPRGTYGPYCQRKCKCLNDGSCDTMIGTCDCPPGFIGADCSQTCPEDHYGQDYVQRRSCGSGQCDPVTGECQCPPGQTGARCQHGNNAVRVTLFVQALIKLNFEGRMSPNKNVFLVIMVWAAILIASVRTVEFATGFLEAASASQVIMEETANMPTVMQQVDNAFAQQVSTAANVKKSVRLEYLGTISINFVIVKEKAPATQ
ncbi:hypothetical protein J1605_017138, partial [Eschrichtius robustus]